ncbi:diguanylate cyclase [Wukongibacter baidiensis]|uniref:diguanylate cyclase domain-containing protein n=1 Tax=Wukongibacter baidiensis TaxID=1723361 RepID=UPI003D7FFB5F
MEKPVILCVDDEKMVLDSLERQLGRELEQHYILEFAESGVEGLEIIEEYLEQNHRIAVVISDQVMPEMSGDEFLIAVHKLSPTTVKIMLTGQGNDESIINAINHANLYRYIGKPWEKADVTLTIKEAAKSYMQEQKLIEQNINLQNMYQKLKEMNTNLEKMVYERTRELHIQKAFFEQLFANSPEGIAILDNEFQITNINDAFEDLFLYSIDDVKNQNINELLVPDDYMNKEYHSLNSILCGSTMRFESVRKRKDGSLIDVSVTGYPIMAENEQFGICLIFNDISQRKQTEEQLRYLSLHDALTGLYNRAYFEQEMKRIGSLRDSWAGVMVCDIDALKLINDTLGHQAGDDLIKKAGSIIKNCIRPSDMLARIGGDEFAILLTNADISVLADINTRIKEAMRNHNSSNPEYILSISVGYAEKKQTSNSIEDVFKEADANMYHDKILKSSNIRKTIIENLIDNLKERDFFASGHAERLKLLAARFGQRIGLCENRIKQLVLLAEFHDIGKVGIHRSIIFKPDDLTPEEFTQIQKHCEIGYRIAKSIPDIVHISDLIAKHHEWWDGNGYPVGLKEEKIPLECRIINIIDAYVVMTDTRPYCEAKSHDEAKYELRKFAGIQFDPKLVDCFVDMLEE